ncbi:MAG: L-threonylcarbamoyladenylate synthase, partial [Sphingopyxis sp.]|nr:L-threonylcarbamoyladenylate synthase [Sphingopyxis sp.]
MPTRLLPYGPAAVEEAARHIAAGRPCAVATETVYGLAGDATESASVAAIYAAKGRPSFNPLIAHVASTAMAEAHATFTVAARALAAAFWPGPLTMVLPRHAGSSIASLATAGLDTVALRSPAHPAMQDLIAALGRPLAAPSANASGGVSPTTAAHVMATLNGRIAAVIDAGPCIAGIESTIVRPMDDCLILLRPGPITPAMLTAACGLPVVSDDSGTVSAPGQLASHYAPG